MDRKLGHTGRTPAYSEIHGGSMSSFLYFLNAEEEYCFKCRNRSLTTVIQLKNCLEDSFLVENGECCGVVQMLNGEIQV